MANDILLSGLGLSQEIYELILYVIVFTIYAIVMKAVNNIAFSIFTKLSKKTKTNIDDLIVEKTKPVAYFLLLVLGAYYLSFNLTILENYRSVIDKIFISFMFAFGGWVLYSVINSFVEHYGGILAKKTKSNIDDTLFPFIKTAIKLAVWVVVFLQILSIWNIDITPLLASAGIFGLAIAFAAQETIKNLFGGVSLSIDRAIKIDDWVIIDGQKMKVVEVGVRSTKFLTLDGTLKIYPNSILSESVIENLNDPPRKNKKVRVNVGVAYGSDVDKVKSIIKEEAEKLDAVVKDSISVYMTEMGDYALNFLLVCEVPSVDDMWITKTKLVENIYKRLIKEGIEIPFPTRTVYLREEDGEHGRDKQ